jgi:hypothetical protein
MLLLIGVATACDALRRDTSLPPIETIREAYRNGGIANATIEFEGNVVVLRVREPPAQLQRGGSLWAKVGPYIYLFNPATRDLFTEHRNIAGVRVITTGPGGREIARATLASGAINELLWMRALNLVGHAVNSGTERPATLEDLVRWGERYTEFRYNSEFVPEPSGRSSSGNET